MEREAGIEIKYLDAIVDAGQYALGERFVLAQAGGGQFADLRAHPDGAIHLSLAERVRWPSSCH